MRDVKSRATTGVTQRKMLKHAKARHLGIFEAMNLSFLGKSDGRAGLPRQSQTGDWDSPRFRKESNAYNESCDLVWGMTQLDLKDDYAEVGALIDEIKRKEEILEKLLQEASAQPDESYYTSRMGGEEDLNDNQVRARRSRELGKKSAPYHARVRTLEDEIRNAYTRLDERYNHIIETNNGSRLVCERLKYHTEQRRDAYWNAALRTHSFKEKIPVIPEPLPESEAELTYTAQHKMLEDEAVAMLSRKERMVSRQEENSQSHTVNISKQKEVV